MKNWIKFAKHGVPEIDVVVGVSEAEVREFARLGIKLPSMTESNPTAALLDTGAHRSFVPQEFVDRLKLLPCGRSEIHTPIAGSVPIDLYAVSLKVVMRRNGAAGWHKEALVGTVQVGVLPTNHSGRGRAFPKPIVGRDVLSTCRFTYDGPNEQLEFDHDQRRRKGFVAACTSMFRRPGSN